MEDNTESFEILLERATNYSKTSYELIKLKALDKSSQIISTYLMNFFIIVLLVFFLIFISIGLAFWLGDEFGKIQYGFFAVAAFYCIMGIVSHFFLYTYIKKVICNYIIKLILK